VVGIEVLSGLPHDMEHHCELARQRYGGALEAETFPDSPAAQFARQGGLEGGKACAATLTAERRHEIAVLAAKRRWGSKREDDG
jgi:hypothetical protein